MLRHALWTLFVPSQTSSASLVYMDLYNGSDRDITVTSFVAIKDVAVAVTGLVSARLLLTRTTAVGTGGTAATSEGTDIAAPAITRLQSNPLPTGISARLTPTGGGTAGAIISERHVMPEELGNSANMEPLEFLSSPLVVPEGTGLRIVQGTVASVGKIGFGVNFY